MPRSDRRPHGSTWTFTFEQFYRSVAVVDARIDVRIHGNGRLCHLGSTAQPIADAVPLSVAVTPLRAALQR
jgi:hypothetical protein